MTPPAARGEGDGEEHATTGPVLAAAGLCVLPALALARFAREVPLIWLGGAWATIAVATFLVLAWDKAAAVRGRRRVPEAWLHLLELLGGWPGTFCAQAWLRHKSAKLTYRAVLWLIVLLHQTLALDLLLGWRGARALVEWLT